MHPDLCHELRFVQHHENEGVLCKTTDQGFVNLQCCHRELQEGTEGMWTLYGALLCAVFQLSSKAERKKEVQ